MAEGQTILKPVIIEGYIRKKVSLFDGRGRLVGQKSAANITSDFLLLLTHKVGFKSLLTIHLILGSSK